MTVSRRAFLSGCAATLGIAAIPFVPAKANNHRIFYATKAIGFPENEYDRALNKIVKRMISTLQSESRNLLACQICEPVFNDNKVRFEGVLRFGECTDGVRLTCWSVGQIGNPKKLTTQQLEPHIRRANLKLQQYLCDRNMKNVRIVEYV